MIKFTITSKPNSEQNAILRELSNHCIEIIPDETYGAIYRFKPNYWNGLFGAYLSQSDQLFWNQLVKNDPAIYCHDRLTTERATLGERAFFWEKFIKNNQKSHFRKDAESNYQLYTFYLIADAIDFGTNRIYPMVGKEFDGIIKRHQNSDVAKSITVFRNNFYERQKHDTSALYRDDFMMRP